MQDPSIGTKKQTKARSRYVSNACEVCRKRKIKCDGQTPSCSPCLKRGDNCIFVERSKRGPKRKAQESSSNQAIQDLESEIFQLAEELGVNEEFRMPKVAKFFQSRTEQDFQSVKGDRITVYLAE